MFRKFPLLLWLALPMAYLLYFYGLGAKGMLGPDEPRYAAIAQQMARSGDWITPVLWGHPWFEKPALLYWMNAAAFRAGLGPDLAPRLPVALLSVAFLVFYWWMLRREFGCRAAWMATLILATCGAWIGYSQVGVTDVPLAATYSAAMLLALPWVAKRDGRALPAAAALLGLAVLAKSLVPIALAAPLALCYRQARDLLRPRVLVPFFAVALPWYIWCYARNGRAFLDDLFWKQQFQRVTSPSLMHVEKWWYYLPVLILLLLPWSPLIGTLARGAFYREPRRRFLLAIVVWGLVGFSIPINKLPGYLLPLMPAAAALMALALDELDHARGWLAACAVLLIVFPVAAALLPDAIAAGGLSKVHIPPFQPAWLLPLALVPVVWVLDGRGLRLAAVASIAAGATLGAAWLKYQAAPALETAPSARVLWRQAAEHSGEVCVEEVNRGMEYSLNYYAGWALPSCADFAAPWRIRPSAGGPPRVDPAAFGSVQSTVRK